MSISRCHTRLGAIGLLIPSLVLSVPGFSATAEAEELPPTSGPVLYQPSESQLEELGYNLFANLLSTDGTQLQLPHKSSSLNDESFSPSPSVVGKFSPDGGSVVTPTCVSATCDSDAEYALEITTAVNDEPRQIGHLAAYPSDLAWSPDGSAIAALVIEPSSDPFAEAHYRIVRFSVATGAMTTVVSDTASFQVVDAGISWGPTGSIAFIGNGPARDGVVNQEDIYTVPASGGTPTRYNAVFPDDGDYSDEAYCEGQLHVGFYQPAWSPDGSSIAARMLLNDERAVCDDATGDRNYACDTRNQLVEVTLSGQPTVLKELPVEYYAEDPDNPGICRRAFMTFKDWEPEPVWNLDGVHLLYGYAPADSNWGGDGVNVRIIDTETLAETTPVTMRDKLESGDELERSYIGYYKDWQPCPTGTCVLWDEPEYGADVRVSIAGYADAGRVGAAEPVTITVINRGPEPATDVSFEVNTPTATTTQGWVRFKGAHAGWSCDYSDPARLRCSGPGLADEEAVKVELGVIGKKVTGSAQITASATSTSTDPDLTNNQAASSQAIRKLTAPPPPKPPKGRTTTRSKFGWYYPFSGKRWAIYAENIVYKEPSEADGLPGWYGATLWAYAPKKQVYRVNLKTTVCGPRGGICDGFIGHPSSGGDSYRTNSQTYSSYITGDRVIFEGTKVQRAKWKFFPGRTVLGATVRTGTAKKAEYDLPR